MPYSEDSPSEEFTNMGEYYVHQTPNTVYYNDEVRIFLETFHAVFDEMVRFTSKGVLQEEFGNKASFDRYIEKREAFIKGFSDGFFLSEEFHTAMKKDKRMAEDSRQQTLLLIGKATSQFKKLEELGKKIGW